MSKRGTEPPWTSSRGARARPTREQTRRRVLDAAYAVFAARGIAASSLAEIAAEAQMTKGAIYSNFAGKDDLVLALMEERALARMTSAADRMSSTADTEVGVREVGRVLVEEMHADAAWHRILAEYYALSAHDQARREALRQRRREARDALARSLQRLSESTGFALPLPPDELAVALFALSNGLAVESGIDPESVPDDLFGRLLALLAREP